MKTAKPRTYFERLMESKSFKEKFEREYETLVISEKIAQLRHQAHLTQEELAKKIHTTKSAISRYESSNYRGYSLPLLQKIAEACGAELRIGFVVKRIGSKKLALQ